MKIHFIRLASSFSRSNYKHDNGKRISVAEMISRGMSKDLIEKETKKCIVLCRKHHAEVEMKKNKT